MEFGVMLRDYRTKGVLVDPSLQKKFSLTYGCVERRLCTEESAFPSAFDMFVRRTGSSSGGRVNVFLR